MRRYMIIELNHIWSNHTGIIFEYILPYDYLFNHIPLTTMIRNSVSFLKKKKSAAPPITLHSEIAAEIL